MKCYRLTRIAGLLAGVIVSHGVGAAQAAECGALAKLRIPASAIGLPTGGAWIDTAVSSPVTGDVPSMCAVTGQIAASEAGSPPIRFQINLPAAWNGKALHFGGGGFNGTVVTGVDNLPGTGLAASAPPRPVARGFATFGSDSGHSGHGFSADFGRDETAARNYLGEAVKKVRDVAGLVIARHYGKPARRFYFAGGSKGGQEGLVAAQRYGADYDGVISYYPAKDMAGQILGWSRMLRAAYGPGGTPLSPASQALVRTRALAACDGLDGLQDGVIANVKACESEFSPRNLACQEGDKPGQCLTEAEVATLKAATEPFIAPLLLAEGQSTVGPFPVMVGGSPERVWMSAEGGRATAYGGFVAGVTNNFWSGPSPVDPFDLKPLEIAGQMQKFTRYGDATSVNLDGFLAHGGKLIVVQGSTDMLVPPAHTSGWYARLKAHNAGKGDFVRYYVQPGFGHGGGDYLLTYDSLTALDNWVEKGLAPQDQAGRDANPASGGRSMPLCDYPAFPRYVSGDPKLAASFRCALD